MRAVAGAAALRRQAAGGAAASFSRLAAAAGLPAALAAYPPAPPGAARACAPVRCMTASPTKKARRAAASGRAARADAAQLKPFTVALVGRPNVGKSSLFNRLTGTRLAIVDDTPGTTRDWKEAPGAIGGLSFTVMDTGGLEDREGRNTIESRMLEHTRAALAHADVVLFIVDGRAGVSAADVTFARWVKRLRGGGARGMHLVANKTEGWAGAPDGEERWSGLLRECYPLGLGEPTPVSSSQGDGLEDLYRLLEPYGRVVGEAAVATQPAEAAGAAATATDAAAAAEAAQEEVDGAAVVETDVPVEPDDDGDGADFDASTVDVGDVDGSGASLPSDPAKRRAVLARLARESGPIQLAIVGRPNAGKSTLVNQLLGRERVMAGPTPGLTRDAVTVELPPLPDGRVVRLVDTAGMRRWGSWDLTTPLEGAAVGLAKKALERAHVVALVVDGSAGAPAGLTHDRPVFQRPTPGGAAAATAVAPAAGRGRRGGANADGDAAVTGWGLTRQDLAIAEQVLDEGRGLVVVLNKTDALADKAAVVSAVRRQLDGMHQGTGVEVVATSALRGGGVGGLLPAVLRTYDAWNVRVSTGKLNAWLRLTARHHPPPSVTLPGRTRPGRDGAPTTSTLSVPLRLKYLTQTTARPPTFALFANRASLPENYSRFLVNALRREFGLGGVPLRLVVRAAANPYTPSGRAQGAAAATARKRKEGSRRRAAAATSSSATSRGSSATTSLEVAGSGSGAGINVVRTSAAASPSRRSPQRTGARA